MVTLGPDAVKHYEAVKTFYTRFGHALETAFADAVGGIVGRPGEADVITRLGEFEFCAAANTKNAAGERAQLDKVGPGRIVQVSGVPRPGRISGVDFLRLHGVAQPERIAGECEVVAMRAAVPPASDQLELVL